MRSEADVPSILKKDGVLQAFLDKANQEVVNIPELIATMGINRSWAYTLVNTESNSATLICQLPGEGNREHFHPSWNEWWLIVQGVWEWNVEGVSKIIKEGDLVFIPKNTKHKITALGPTAAIRLAVSRYDVEHVYSAE